LPGLLDRRNYSDRNSSLKIQCHVIRDLFIHFSGHFHVFLQKCCFLLELTMMAELACRFVAVEVANFTNATFIKHSCMLGEFASPPQA